MSLTLTGTLVGVLLLTIVIWLYRGRARKEALAQQLRQSRNPALRYLDIDVQENVVYITEYGEVIENVYFRERSDQTVLMYYNRFSDDELLHSVIGDQTIDWKGDFLELAIMVDTPEKRERLEKALYRFYVVMKKLRALTDFQLAEVLPMIETTKIQFAVKNRNDDYLRTLRSMVVSWKNEVSKPIQHLTVARLEELVAGWELAVDHLYAYLKHKLPDDVTYALGVGFGTDKKSKFQQNDRVLRTTGDDVVYVFVKYLSEVEYGITFDYPLDCVISDQQGKFKKDFSGHYKLNKD